MKSSLVIGAMTLALAFLGTGIAGYATTGDAGPKVKYDQWRNENQDRVIPVKIYMPENIKAPLPVVVFSHGLGGSREAAIYLGNYWAEHGYIGVFIQHPGSDESFWKPSVDPKNPPTRQELLGKFRNQVGNPIHAVNRAADVHFVLDELERMNASDPDLKGKMDLNEIAIAGHSYGSWTALTASGQKLITPRGRDMSSGDPRIKCAIYLSPTAPKQGQDPAVVFGDIKIPGLHFTGTKDDSPVNDTKAESRRIAFDNITKSDQYLLILNDADHGVFGGRQRRAMKPEDAIHQELTEKTSTAFLDAYLKHDEKAKQWLQRTAPGYLKPYGAYEVKVVPSATKGALRAPLQQKVE